MKKLSIILVALFASIISFSQTTQFGIKAGLNLADLKDEAIPTTDSRTGYHVGALAHIHLSPTWALQPEVMYSLQGAEYGEGSRARLNYINVPVLIQYMHASGFRVQTGPQVGVLIGAKSKRAGVEVDLDDEVKTRDFSWSFGAGYLTRSGFGIDARYNLGISDNRSPATVHDFSNRVVQVGVFYQFQK